MHILFEALDPKRGMTLGELLANVEKAKKITDSHTDFDQTVKFVVAKPIAGTIKSFEIEA